jgi:TolB-like protein/tRNA A-37 threonylcarbamoyl transferase component Bud32/Flp pilus assembly protein TadD
MKCPACHSDNPEDSRFCGKCGTWLPGSGPVPFSKTITIEPSLKTLRKGAVFADKYRIIGEIGRGGMGIVLKAEDTKLRRPVALKLLPAELSRSPEARERFLREAQSAAGLDHPHICTVYEVGERDGQDYIAMAYIDGKSLKEMLAQGPLKIEEALDIGLQVAEGLAEAHRQGVVHRDIKPANIMLTAQGQAKIMDFGLARLESESDLTRTAVVMGTVAYMSPEQALGKKVDPRTDIWSLGCTLYEMLAGHSPFQGGHEQAVLQAVLHGEPQPISALRQDIPAGFEKIINRCLKKNPLDRYPDVGALISDLKSVNLADIARTSTAAVPEEAPSVAVLAFADMSPDKDQDYFGEGIAEELINALAHIRGLRVVARTSAFALKGRSLDVREIGRLLSVKAVLEGSVRKAGDRLRITAQLINVEDGFHLWSERFDRKMDDIFAIQDEISAAIVESLKVTLKVGEKTALRKRRADDPEAYNLYLKGLYFAARPSAEPYNKALSFYRAASDKDPNFALAYAGTASVYAGLGIMNLAPPAEMWPKAKAALKTALSLDEDLAEAHAVAAALAFWYEWDWDAANRSFDRVLSLNPGDAVSHGMRGWFCLNRRRFDEAIKEIKRALELDPLMPLYYAWSVGLHWSVGRPDEALQEFTKAIEIDPNLGLAYFHGGVAYFLKGRWGEGIELLERGKKQFAPPGWIEAIQGLALLRKGDRDKAARILEEMIESKKTVKNVSAAGIAWLAAELGKLDLAFEFLDKAYEERDILMAFIHVYTEVFSPALSADPRFKGVLARMNLSGLRG